MEVWKDFASRAASMAAGPSSADGVFGNDTETADRVARRARMIADTLTDDYEERWRELKTTARRAAGLK